ncbi:copper resistance protein B [Schlegelella sp. ID0723]|uniref:Copper resistance protein B n=2 Tax=Piscinibacter koreensis TaxID=2742824 RepID=A0A7Y6NSC2_9BURK|nr:copper resistance protein B [Schlegelella koreensis]
MPVMDQQIVPFLLLDRLEYRLQKGQNALGWDAQASIGTDYNKAWLKSEGEKAVGGSTEQAETQLLYARLISPFWYLQVGARNDARPGPSRNYGVLAIQGLAPYWFNVEGSLFVRGGEVAGRFEAEYDQKITQRWVLQPRAETNLSSSSDRARGLGGGFRDVELGLRLRYEIVREVAPYIGVNWSRKLGSTASLARQQGDSVTSRGVVAGIRVWY